MSALNYTVTPDTVGFTIGVQEVTKDSVVIVPKSVSSFKPFLHPAGNVGQKILSGLLWPIAQFAVSLITAIELAKLVKMQSITVPVGSTIGYKFNVEGVTLEVDAADLNISSHDGMLMAAGTVTVK